jgi:hypothetical protein
MAGLPRGDVNGRCMFAFRFPRTLPHRTNVRRLERSTDDQVEARMLACSHFDVIFRGPFTSTGTGIQCYFLKIMKHSGHLVIATPSMSFESKDLDLRFLIS